MKPQWKQDTYGGGFTLHVLPGITAHVAYEGPRSGIGGGYRWTALSARGKNPLPTPDLAKAHAEKFLQLRLAAALEALGGQLPVDSE